MVPGLVKTLRFRRKTLRNRTRILRGHASSAHPKGKARRYRGIAAVAVPRCSQLRPPVSPVKTADSRNRRPVRTSSRPRSLRQTQLRPSRLRCRFLSRTRCRFLSRIRCRFLSRTRCRFPSRTRYRFPSRTRCRFPNRIRCRFPSRTRCRFPNRPRSPIRSSPAARLRRLRRNRPLLRPSWLSSTPTAPAKAFPRCGSAASCRNRRVPTTRP